MTQGKRVTWWDTGGRAAGHRVWPRWRGPEPKAKIGSMGRTLRGGHGGGGACYQDWRSCRDADVTHYYQPRRGGSPPVGDTTAGHVRDGRDELVTSQKHMRARESQQPGPMQNLFTRFRHLPPSGCHYPVWSLHDPGQYLWAAKRSNIGEGRVCQTHKEESGL